MTAMLASAANRAEAEMAAAFGADVIDLKDPSAGALGALPLATIAQIVGALAGRRPVSATIGDLPMAPGLLMEAALATASTAVDFVKVGLFEHRDRRDCVAALAPVARKVRLIGVLFADEGLDLSLLDALDDAGFAGAMLDTAAKHSGGLRAHLRDGDLAAFVRRAQSFGLITGLAGSLTLDDIAPLVHLRPTYLGFRTALCRGAARTAPLDPQAFAAVRARLAACFDGEENERMRARR
ncbi:MAG: (5-formylfuran-3-yl)methyl phosphate synthase [Sulfurifustaceae bacterium]